MGYIFGSWIRGSLFFFDQLNPQPDYDGAFSEAEKISVQKYGLDISVLRSSSSLTEDHFFKMNGYYACTAQIPNKNGSLGLIILYPLDSLEHQITSQRLAFGLAVCAALLALGIFSWLFTGRMIRPLKESRKKQTEFIAAASHELRSPVTVILSAAASMEQAAPSELPHFTAMIRSEAERISRLVRDLLSLANADNQNWSIHPDPVEADTLLLDTFEKYEPLMQAKKLHLQIALPEEPLCPCLLDQGRISQVLDILLDNALSYVPAGGKIRLSLSEKKNISYLRFPIMAQVFQKNPEKKYSGVFTVWTPPEKTSSISVLAFPLPGKSFLFMAEPLRFLKLPVAGQPLPWFSRKSFQTPKTVDFQI